LSTSAKFVDETIDSIDRNVIMPLLFALATLVKPTGIENDPICGVWLLASKVIVIAA